MRQRRWLELIKDYDLTLDYCEGKANKVADALSRKGGPTLSTIKIVPKDLCEEFRKLNLEIIPQGVLSAMSIEPDLYSELRIKQKEDSKLQKIREEKL